MTWYRLSSLYAALFCSGAAALVYQSTWGRMLQRVFGVSDLAVATVLATFFLGLGLGSALGGKWGANVTRPARTYALLEIAIGVWALASLFLIPRVHSVYGGIGDASFTTLTILRFIIAVVLLLPPTILMGATLPILIAATAKKGLVWNQSGTWLYAVNTLGAVFGAGVTGLYLVPMLGARISLIIAAGASFVAAAIIFTTWKESEQDTSTSKPAQDTATLEEADEDSVSEDSADEEPALRPERPTREKIFGPFDRVQLAMFLASVAGFASLAGEVVWTRVLRLVVQGTTQAFAAMLVNFLIGIAVGSLIAERALRRTKSPLRLLGQMQLVLAGLSIIAMYVAANMPRILILLQSSETLVPHEASVVLAASAILLLPLALALGTTIPIAWAIAGGDSEEAADNSGRVLAANTFGGLLGSLCAGFLLVTFPGFGPSPETSVETTSFRGVDFAIAFLIVVHLIAASIALRASAKTMFSRVFAIAFPIAIVAAIIVVRPTVNVPYLLDAWWDTNYAFVNGPDDSWDDNVVFLVEGRNTTVSIIDRDGLYRLFNDGRPESGFGSSDPGFGEELATLGSLPTIFAENHGRAMIVGLGAGHSTAVATGGPFEEIQAVELEGAIVDASRYLYNLYPERQFPLDDPRVELVVDDARAQLVLAEEGSYDAIISQPSHPWLAGSSALYTHEFFEECDRALAPGGVLALWTNLFRMDVPHLRSLAFTLHEVFPYVNVFVVEDSSFIFAASDQPLNYDEGAAAAISSEGLRPYLRPFALDDLVDFAAVTELDTAGIECFQQGGTRIVDDRPAFEFDLAQLPFDADIPRSQLDQALEECRWLGPESFEGMVPEVRADVLLQRAEWARDRRSALTRLQNSLDGLPIAEHEMRLVRGSIAETMGDVSGAVEAWNEDPECHSCQVRINKLYEDELNWGALLERAEAGNLRGDPSPFYRAVLAAENRPAAARLLEQLPEPGVPQRLREAVRVFAADDCDAMLALVEEEPGYRVERPVMRLAARCAFRLGRLDQGEQLLEDWNILHRARAADLANEARSLNGKNNGLAMRYFWRALRHNPGHAVAASDLAAMLDLNGQTERAERLILDTWDRVHRLPAAREQLRSAADSLGIDLP